MRNKESGITLIALIISIIILVLLAAVSLKAITGEESIIQVSTDATEDYNILQYKEQIEQLRESIILQAEMTGERLTLERLATEMSKEATWIKSSIANVKEGSSELNNDIIVTTIDGYIFQLYYSESYGQKFIEYLGREDGNAIPEVTVSKVENKINVAATEAAAGINGIDVIHKGGVIKSEKASTLEYDAEKTGWYTIKVTSNKGKLRFAWVRISSTMIAPKIEIVKPVEKPSTGWYKENVLVRISAGSEKTSKIYYTTSNWREDPSLEITEKIGGVVAKEIELSLQGINNIYAYAVDDASGESEIVKLSVLIDSQPPTLREVNVTGIKGDNGWYRGEVGLSLENARDNASGVAGYYYYIPTKEEIESNFIPELNQMLGENGQVGGNAIGIKTIMRITEDGIKTVIVRLIDRAGNISSPGTVQVKADNTPPIISLVEVKEDDIAGDGFIITAVASDQPLDAPLSEVTYSYYVQEVGQPGRRFIAETKESRCMVEGLKAKTEYMVYVDVRDEAGNMASLEDGTGTKGIKVETGDEGTTINPGGNRRRRRPVAGGGGTGGNQGQSMVAIQLTPKNGSFKMDSGWYSGNVEVRIICIATEPQMIKYTVTRGEEIEVDEDPVGEEGPITFDVTNEGITTVVAWTVDDSGNATPKKTLNVRIDKNNPEKPDLYVLKDGTVDISNESEKWLGIDGKVTAAGADENSKIGLKINKIEYEISKTGEMTRTDSQNGQIVDITSKDLGDDGTYTIKAWAVDQSGRKSSDYSEVTVMKDTIAPTNVTLTAITAMSQRISVRATGQDTNGSGIYEYEFKYKESAAGGYKTAGIITVNNQQSCNYVYTGLKIGGTYDLLVEVRDKAGNKKTATTDGYVSTKEWVAKVGDYVKYTPKSGSHSVTAANSGNGSAQSYSTQTFNWRIWDIDEDSDKLVLIADGVTPNLTLNGAQGYNNAVKIMNDMCKACYSSGKAVGRAFNFDDIEAKLKTKPSASFTSKTKYTSASYRYYPIIHMYERYSNVDGNDIEANGGEFANGEKALGLSEQKKYYSATESGATAGRILATSYIEPRGTYLSTTLATASLYTGDRTDKRANMVTKVGDSTSNMGAYWLASRCVWLYNSNYCNFCVRYVSSGSVDAYYVFWSYVNAYSNAYAVRPVVDIPLSSVTLGATGAGTSGLPYSLTGY